MTLSGLRSLDKSAIVGLLFVVSGRRDPQGRKLLVGFEPTKAFLCFVHGRSGPAQSHRGRTPALHIAGDATHGPHQPRYDLPSDQFERILSEKRGENGLDLDLKDIASNPYALSERFVGNGPDDIIPFSRIDHGAFPSPDLGGQFIGERDDSRRLRALCVDRLKYETKHTFMTCGQLLQDVNRRLTTMPDWKRFEFTSRHLQVDRSALEPMLVFRREGERDYCYLRHVYEAEREIETCIRKLAARPDIRFKSPVTDRYWKDLLLDLQSPHGGRFA